MKKNLFKLALYILLHISCYVVGSFVAMDFNPMHWWLFDSTGGRLIVVGLELTWLGALISQD